MQKNTSGQKVIVFAFNSTTNAPTTGDAANITAYISKDFGAVTALTDTSATEMDSTNAKGYYLFDISQTETNADIILVSAKSSTSNIVVVGAPASVFTTPANFTAASIDSNGRVDVIKLAGTTQTARDIGASVLLSSGTGTGQLDFTSGVVKGNVVQLLGTAWLTPGTAGTPDVNVKLWNGLTTVALPLTPTTAGRTLDVSAGGEAGVDWANVGSPTTSVSLTNTTVATVTTVTNQLTAAAIATGVWQDTTAGDFTVASSIGKSLYTSGAVPGAAGGLFIAGTNAATTITSALTTTFTGNLTGSVGSVTGLTASNLDATISSRLAPTTAGRTLDVTATGAAGIDWANVENPTATVGLSDTSILAVTGSVGSVNTNVTIGGTETGAINSDSFAAGAITAAAIATDAIGSAEISAAAVTKIQTGLATPTNITAGTITTATNVTTVNGLAANVITAASLAADAGTEIADALLGRNIAGGSSTGRTVAQAFAAQRNKVAFDVPSAGQFTVYDTDDTTSLWTGTYTAGTSSTYPVTVLDPG